MKNGRCVFTLIELLVCVSIIVLLMAMLLPSLRKARENGYKVLCAGNLRQLATVSNTYMGDNDAWMPPYDTNVNLEWNAVFINNRYIPEPEVGKPSVLVCPTHFTNIDQNRGTWTQLGRTYGMRYRYGWSFRMLSEVKTSTGKSLGATSRFIIFADSNHGATALDFQWYIFINYQATNPVHARHLNMCNSLFGDGHVESLTSQQLTDEYAFVPGSILK